MSPQEIKRKIPLSDESAETTLRGRKIIQKILDREDPRRFIIAGPCSVHDTEAAKEYAGRISDLAKKVESKLFLLMRTYFEKPRTTVGWKGLVNDPLLDNSFRIEEGLIITRQLLSDITRTGMPVATEVLDPVTPQYLSDLISWSAIGARTTESQTHREIASGLSSPIGFKNSTSGNVKIAINASRASSSSHHFLGIDEEGRTAIVTTNGNSYCHLILRGGAGRPNYDSVSVRTTETELEKAGLPLNIVVDCSHDNSHKDHTLQPMVLDDCINQIANGNVSIVGFMIESNLCGGNQKISSDLKYGVSITDKCVDWNTTEEMILDAYNRL